MDVHPTKNGIYRYWPIAIYIYIWSMYIKDTKDTPENRRHIHSPDGYIHHKKTTRSVALIFRIQKRWRYVATYHISGHIFWWYSLKFRPNIYIYLSIYIYIDIGQTYMVGTSNKSVLEMAIDFVLFTIIHHDSPLLLTVYPMKCHL